MVEANIKGKVLEKLVQEFLSQQGYQVLTKDDSYPGIIKERGDLRLQGRGSTHQIDALGQADFSIPFV